MRPFAFSLAHSTYQKQQVCFAQHDRVFAACVCELHSILGRPVAFTQRSRCDQRFLWGLKFAINYELISQALCGKKGKKANLWKYKNIAYMP
jgi:hypothetical protein